MNAEQNLEPTILVKDEKAQVVVYPDTWESRRNVIAGSSEAAQQLVSFSEKQIAYLSEREDHLNR